MHWLMNVQAIRPMAKYGRYCARSLPNRVPNTSPTENTVAAMLSVIQNGPNVVRRYLKRVSAQASVHQRCASTPNAMSSPAAERMRAQPSNGVTLCKASPDRCIGGERPCTYRRAGLRRRQCGTREPVDDAPPV